MKYQAVELSYEGDPIAGLNEELTKLASFGWRPVCAAMVREHDKDGKVVNDAVPVLILVHADWRHGARHGARRRLVLAAASRARPRPRSRPVPRPGPRHALARALARGPRGRDRRGLR